jgi:uncharacterized protein (TIGR03437 family)
VTCPGSFEVLEPIVNSIEPSSGSPGSSVVINGNGFYSVNSTDVYFGNVKAEVMSMTETQINVKVPSTLLNGIWMVQVYNDNNKISTTVNFTVP